MSLRRRTLAAMFSATALTLPACGGGGDEETPEPSVAEAPESSDSTDSTDSTDS